MLRYPPSILDGWEVRVTSEKVILFGVRAMAIDLEADRLLTLTEVTRLPVFARRRNGRPLNIATVWRWHQHGVRGVRLETIVAGGQRMTSVEAVGEFVRALTAAADARTGKQPSRVAKPLSRQRERAITAAEKRLASAGV